MATIKDVAKEAGVAICTVSYAINGTAPVAEETKRRIFAAIEKLDYHPNRVAQGLVKRKTDTIGLVLSRSASESFGHQLLMMETLRGVTESASQAGYHILLLYDQEDGGKEGCPECGTPLGCYRSKSIDGLIFLSPRKCQKTVEKLAQKGFPVVIAGGLREAFPFPVLDIDNVKGAQMAVEYLLELGHRRIGFLSPDSLSYIYCAERLQGYVQALAEHGVAVDERYQGVADYTVEGCSQVTREMLSQPERPTALFLGSDWMYPYVLQTAGEIGISVPGDLSVVGFDDSLAARIVSPALTAVRCPAYEIGYKATSLLIEIIESEESTLSRSCELPTELIIRDSTAPLNSMR